MSLGLVLSAVTNLVICFSPSMNSFMNVLDTEGKATMTLSYQTTDGGTKQGIATSYVSAEADMTSTPPNLKWR